MVIVMISVNGDDNEKWQLGISDDYEDDMQKKEWELDKDTQAMYFIKYDCNGIWNYT